MLLKNSIMHLIELMKLYKLAKNQYFITEEFKVVSTQNLKKFLKNFIKKSTKFSKKF